MTEPETTHKRTIRSFVRREGRMTIGQKKAYETLWPQFGLAPDQKLTAIDALFARTAPVVLEIGFGMGDSLAQQAITQSQNNYIGIEVHRPGVGHLLSLIAKHELHNIRIYCADAVEVLKHCIPDNSLDTVQIFFPDPWPKKRHHKRRLVQLPIVKLIATKLKTGGTLHLATDWQNYAEHMLEVLNTCSELTNISTNGPYVERPDSRPLTKFESRGKRLGHGVWDLVFRKNSL
ncbi:tRNA (guanosine(46)-N7)-methyltransferase TrmB [Kaarinaea lacus]